MVAANIGPGKFYGNSLPRPRFYTDVKFNDERVDPPTPMLDPFLSWASDAHWSMGGLSFKRLRLQGRIEGNIKRLRVEREKFQKKRSKIAGSPSPIDDSSNLISTRLSPPPAPIANKGRRRFMAVIEEDDDEEEIVNSNYDGCSSRKRKPARRLDDDFDRVADDVVLERKEKRTHVKRPSLDLNIMAMTSEIENVYKKPVRVTRSSSSSSQSRTRSSRRRRLVKRV
ncbi:uncharacterized protein LOC124912543 [Impatiens glandulifera]|uniref:uncharacterized protein LOC124912543 n=1 Tax=Impatiens glandulifera TaxID=253017 RepID=UPI001FB11619|nr:uncharacterized protein LOC124912543 [Impatiens glandulifera]